MAKQSVIRDIIAYASFVTFLWAIKMTREEYWHEVYKQERNQKERDNDGLLLRGMFKTLYLKLHRRKTARMENKS